MVQSESDCIYSLKEYNVKKKKTKPHTEKQNPDFLYKCSNNRRHSVSVPAPHNYNQPLYNKKLMTYY